MGATSSHPSSDEPPKRALHVLRVIPGSPASLAGIQVFFDFIVGIEGSAGQSVCSIQVFLRHGANSVSGHRRSESGANSRIS